MLDPEQAADGMRVSGKSDTEDSEYAAKVGEGAADGGDCRDWR